MSNDDWITNTIWQLGTDGYLHLPAHILHDATTGPHACFINSISDRPPSDDATPCEYCMRALRRRIARLRELADEPARERALRSQVDWWANQAANEAGAIHA